MQEKEDIAMTLERNAREVRYGTVGVMLRIHEGRVVKTVYTTAKTTVRSSKPQEKPTERVGDRALGFGSAE